MRTRSVAALVAAVSLGLTACGGGDDGGGALSEDEFTDAVADICDDTSRDLEDLEFPAEADDVDGINDFGKDASKILTDAVEQLQEIEAPEDLARDFEKLIGVLEDQQKATDDLADANDGDQADSAFNDLFDLGEEQSEIAGDLGIDECDPQGGDRPDTTTTEAAAVETTTAATVPATTAAPITLPTTVAPTVPATPAPTDVPVSSTNFSVVDLTTIFVAPAGFYLEAGTPDQATIDLIAARPEMNEKLLEIGVATLVESSNDRVIADIWVGISRTDAMPADWKNIDCPDGGDLRVTANGVPGVVCYGALDSPIWEIFTATVDDYGISVYTLVPDVTSDIVVDAFLLANP